MQTVFHYHIVHVTSFMDPKVLQVRVNIHGGSTVQLLLSRIPVNKSN